MQKRNKLTKSKRMQYLIVALCAISDCLYRELVDNSPYSLSSWKRIGITKSALDNLRNIVKKQGESLETLHRSIRRNVCPDPPCLDEEWLESICRAALKS